MSPSADGGQREADAAAPSADGGPGAAARMYAHSDTTLYAVDDQNFDLVVLGSFNLPLGEKMNDLAVTPDGQLYGLTGSKLYTIDPGTGAASFVASVTGTSNVAMTFLPNGTLLAADKQGQVRTIQPLSGQVVELGAYGNGYETAGDLVAVADGTMYTIADHGPDGNEATDNVLLTINPVTGAYQDVIGHIGYGQVWGTAYANGNVYAFTREGNIIEIDRTTGEGTLKRSYPSVPFYGAGVSPLVVVE